MGGIIIFAIIGAIVVSMANSEKSKIAESAVGGGIMGGVIVFMGILLFIVLPIMLMSSC